MSDLSNLLERLRDRDAIVMSGLFHAIPVMLEAADTIERLCSDLDEADATIDAFGAVSPQQYQKELAALRSQLVHAKDALSSIATEDSLGAAITIALHTLGALTDEERKS